MLGHDWDYGGDDERAERVWDELRTPVADARRDDLRPPRPSSAASSGRATTRIGSSRAYLHGRLWADDPADRGRLAPFSVVVDEPPVDELDDEFPLRLTTGRRLDSYNTGVQSGGYRSPNRRGETIDLSPEDAERLGVADGEVVRVSVAARARSRRRPAIDAGLRPGLAFMTMHFPDEVDTNRADDRGARPEVGHGRVQGDRRARRPARGRRLTRMDLKVASATPTDVERAAVDAVLGAPGPSRDAVGLHVRRGGERRERHRLLEVLHAVNDRVGWISRGAINHIAERLDVAPADIYGVATFYALFSTVERPPHQVHVCVDLVCRAAGGPTEHDLPAGTLAVAVPRRVRAGAGDGAHDAEPPVVDAVPQVVGGDRIARADRPGRRRLARSTTTGRRAATRRCGGRSPSVPPP